MSFINKMLWGERKNWERLQKFRLPYKFKIIGIGLSVLSFMALIIYGSQKPQENEMVLDLFNKTIVLGLLLASLSRDRTEDEMTQSIGNQSYAYAFVLGVLYALIQPYKTVMVTGLADNENSSKFITLEVYQLLNFMLLVQLLSYWVIRKIY